ncbi:hypothetical protein SRHO_G00007020 [Serrasalmus rhombeus]
MAGSTEPITALVCPDPRCSDNAPVLVGTNIHEICPPKSVTKPDSEASCMRVCAVAPQAMLHTPTAKVSTTAGDAVKWTGPGPLVIPAVADHIAVCKVCEMQPLSKRIFITERASSPALAPGVFVQPTVLFSSALDKDNFLVMLRNESLKETFIPAGTVIAHLHTADTVTVAKGNDSVPRPRLIDPSRFDFGDSLISAECLDIGCLELQISSQLRESQDSDPPIAPLKKSVSEGSFLTCDKSEVRDGTLLRREGPKLQIIDGQLYRVVQKPSATEVWQLVLPKQYVPMVLRSLYDEYGHLGVEKSTELV